MTWRLDRTPLDVAGHSILRWSLVFRPGAADRSGRAKRVGCPP